MNTAEIKTALKERYEAPQYSIFFEVADGTGAHASRRCDAVVMSLWPSRGLELHGMEIKATRADWLRELQKPEKAEGVYQYMDRWWLVVGDSAIVKPGELPPTWGLIAPQSGGLRLAVDAPKLTPKPISRVFLAALLRRAGEMAVAPGEAALKKSFNEGREAGAKYATDHATTGFKVLQATVKAFEDASGIMIDRYSEWRGGQIGSAVKKVMAHKDLDPREELRRLRALVATLLDRVDAEITDSLAIKPVDVREPAQVDVIVAVYEVPEKA